MSLELNYFYGLSEQLKGLIFKALEQKERDWLGFAKRGLDVQLASPGAESSGKANLLLQFTGFEIVTESEGTFTAETSDNDLLVFKLPTRICASYILTLPELDLRESLKVFDNLCARFFSKKTIEAYVPESFLPLAELTDRIRSQRAEILLKKAGVSQTGKGYEMRFDYRGLYHGGDPLRVEKRVRQRIVQMNRET